MLKDELAGREPWWTRLRHLLIPNWIWQLTWLRHLPNYYSSIVWAECTRSGLGVVWDMLWIYVHLNSVPEHYGPYRLWEKPKSEWVQYYGSPYPPVQRAHIATKVYPIEYEVVYNDKVLGAQLAKGLSVRQPVTVGMLQPDVPFRDKLLALLNEHDGKLILKPVFGRSGIGIVIVERTEAGVVVHTPGGDLPIDQFKVEWPVFLQEVIRQDPRMSAIGGSAVNTVRVVTLMTPSHDVAIIGCALRTGVGRSYVDNWSAGGVAIGVDTETGRLRKYGYDIKGHRYTQHPTSGFAFDGYQVPEWQAILQTAATVQRELPFSRLLGMDICLDQTGKPVVIETNGLPDFVFIEQLNGPLLSDPRTLKLFADYGMLVSGAQRRLVHEPFDLTSERSLV